MTQTTAYTNEMETQMPSSPKRLARIAGVLYLFVGIFGGFAEGFVEPRMYAAGNAATTITVSNCVIHSAASRSPTSMVFPAKSCTSSPRTVMKATRSSARSNRSFFITRTSWISISQSFSASALPRNDARWTRCASAEGIVGRALRLPGPRFGKRRACPTTWGIIPEGN